MIGSSPVTRLARVALILCAAIALLLSGIARAADPARIGDRVQVKLGENWVDATVTDVEGQRIRAKIAAGVESWFGPADYRPATTAPPAATTGPARSGAATQAAKPALPAKPTIVVGQKVEGDWGVGWRAGTVTARDGERTKVKFEIGPERWLGPKEVRTIRVADARFYADLKVGGEVLAHDGHSWLRARILAREPERFKIHYVDWSDAWDTWLAPDKIRPIGVTLAGDAPATGSDTATASGGGDDKTAAAPAVPRGVTAGVRELHADKETVTWTVKPDPEATPAQNPAAGPIPLGLKLDERELLEQFHYAAAGVPAPAATLVLYTPDSRTRMVRVALGGARPPEKVELPKGVRVMDVSPDGSQVITREKVGGQSNCLQVSTFAGAKLTSTVVWKPYAEEGELSMAAFIDPTHVLTCDTQGYAILWELPAAAASPATSKPTTQPTPQPRGIYRLKVGSQIRPALSPGRRVLAAEAYGTLRFFDALTGAPLGGVADVSALGGSVTFRPDGGQVALSTAHRIALVDVTSGRLLREVPVPPEFTRGVNTTTEYLASGYLLLGRRYLVVPSQRLIVWEYRFGHTWPVRNIGGSIYYVAALRDGTGGLGLFSARLPHDAAVKAAAAANVKVDDLLVFRPGAGVTLDVSTDAPGDLRQKISDAMEKQLKDARLVVGGPGNLRVSVRTEAGENKSMNYHVFGRGVQTINVAEKIHKVVVELDGKEMWNWTYKVSPSFVVSAKEGQSLEEAVRADMDRSYSMLAGIKIPKDMVRPDSYKVQGSSQVTANGVEAAKP
jgi:hypothetical protein